MKYYALMWNGSVRYVGKHPGVSKAMDHAIQEHGDSVLTLLSEIEAVRLRRQLGEELVKGMADKSEEGQG